MSRQDNGTQPFSTKVFVPTLDSGLEETDVLVNPFAVVITPHIRDGWHNLTAISHNGTHSIVISYLDANQIKQSIEYDGTLIKEYTGRTFVATAELEKDTLDDMAVIEEASVRILLRKGCRVYIADKPALVIK